MDNDISKQERWQPSLKSYIVGFILSIVLTLAAYFLVVEHMLTGLALVASIAFLAVLQIVVQLLFFLHLGKDENAYWDLHVFFFMLSVVLVLVFGSIWIMYHLNYSMKI